MVKLIMGPKGTGKTKQLVALIREAIDVEHGNVVCIEKNKNLTYDIPHTVRLIHASDYAFGSIEFFEGFISGLRSGNYDISHLFIDNFNKLVEGAEQKAIGELLARLDAFSAKEGFKVTISMSSDPAECCECITKYL